MGYYFTSESVSEGHPDKVADQISDAVLDEMLRQDPESKVACETLVTTGLAVIAGEVKSAGYVDIQKTARRVIERIGYNKAEYQFDSKSCGIISAIHEQSQDINRGVERNVEEEQGAGDQGMMFGFACKETDSYMPLTIELSHILLHELSQIRREGKKMKYLRPDAKSQVTVEYGPNWKPLRIDTIVISTQHDEFLDDDEAMIRTIEHDVRTILLPRVKKLLPQRVKLLFKPDMKLFVNPTGKFVIGGPHGDTGLTGRKIIVDTYGGKCPHGGGAFSGKDPTKVDRSAAYMARYVCKNVVAGGLADECQIQLAYAIGVAKPVSVMVNTFGTGKLSDNEIEEIVVKEFDLRPSAIIEKLDLRKPVYKKTASYGHFGKGEFSWEKTDMAEKLAKYLK